MSSALFAPVCAIAPTRRRRFLWAAWWTGAPTRKPFRKPDSFAGGARTRAEALSAAQKAANCGLTEIESSWARAWSNILVGKEPWPATNGARTTEGAPRPRATTSGTSIWQTLGVSPTATLPEIKRAYRARALQTHPDRGGSAEEFRALQSAYESALKRRKHPTKPRCPKTPTPSRNRRVFESTRAGFLRKSSASSFAQQAQCACARGLR